MFYTSYLFIFSTLCEARKVAYLGNEGSEIKIIGVEGKIKARGKIVTDSSCSDVLARRMRTHSSENNEIKRIKIILAFRTSKIQVLY